MLPWFPTTGALQFHSVNVLKGGSGALEKFGDGFETWVQDFEKVFPTRLLKSNSKMIDFMLNFFVELQNASWVINIHWLQIDQLQILSVVVRPDVGILDDAIRCCWSQNLTMLFPPSNHSKKLMHFMQSGTLHSSVPN